MSDSLVNDVASWLKCPVDSLTIIVEREGRLVIRLTNATGDLLVKASTLAGAFEEEAAAMRTLAAEGLPVNIVLALEPGPPALLMAQWAHGDPISADTDPTVLHEVGVILRKIHTSPAVPPYSGHPTVERWIENWFGIVTQWWQEIGFGLPADVAIATTWLDEIRPHLKDHPGTRMLFDGRPDHFLVDQAGRLSLIDVADLQSGDGAMDLAVLELEAPGILQSVMVGYSPTSAEMERFRPIILFYVFLRALAAAEWQTHVLTDHERADRYLASAREVIRQRTA